MRNQYAAAWGKIEPVPCRTAPYFRLQGLLALCALLFVFCFLLLPVEVRASAVYTNGYFRYISEDQSVTIVSYFGREEVVRVPNRIAGNPVNVIAKGAFSDNKNVKTVYLPDTIMSVEEGAFGSAQSVVFHVPEQESAGSSSASEAEQEAAGSSPASEEKQEGAGSSSASGAEQTAGSSSEAGPKEKENGSSESAGENVSGHSETAGIADGSRRGASGVTDASGRLLTVDGEKNLVLVDEYGRETVIDDTQDYTITEDPEGSAVIQNADGEKAEISPEGLIRYTDGEKKQVTENVEELIPGIPAADYGYEQAEAGLTERSGAASSVENSQTVGSSEASGGTQKEPAESREGAAADSDGTKSEPAAAGKKDDASESGILEAASGDESAEAAASEKMRNDSKEAGIKDSASSEGMPAVSPAEEKLESSEAGQSGMYAGKEQASKASSIKAGTLFVIVFLSLMAFAGIVLLFIKRGNDDPKTGE
ncbi:MAG: hypothetical protein K6E30_05995 [Lachnospiraceae bacterium]|nr:hypothetical protein [Lachnospiraceae bacterium]